MKKLFAPCLASHEAVQRSTAISILAPVLLLCAMPLCRAEEARFFRIVGPGASAITGVTPDGYVTWTNELTNVTCTVQTAQSLTGPSNWVDYVQVPVSNHVVINRLFDLNPPAGMALIPAGSFTMGDAMGDTFGNEGPLHTVYNSAFYIGRYKVTKALWDEIYNWAITNGYSFDNTGSGKAANHPVQTVNWYDCLKWCNARSEKEARAPAYYTDAAMTTRYRSGHVTPYVSWNSGYRLPTEAEWEKSARGGLSGRRFPWGDTISFSQANYSAWYPYPYDLSYPGPGPQGRHPVFNDGVIPYTSPAGYFSANGYGLYDMAGNVYDRCWDYFAGYSSNPQTDPRGPVYFGDGYRVFRGGSWGNYADACRTASRIVDWTAHTDDGDAGIRCALPASQ